MKEGRWMEHKKQTRSSKNQNTGSYCGAERSARKSTDGGILYYAHLSPQDVEITRRGGAVDDLPVAPLNLHTLVFLHIRYIIRIFVAHLLFAIVR